MKVKGSKIEISSSDGCSVNKMPVSPWEAPIRTIWNTVEACVPNIAGVDELEISHIEIQEGEIVTVRLHGELTLPVRNGDRSTNELLTEAIRQIMTNHEGSRRRRKAACSSK